MINLYEAYIVPCSIAIPLLFGLYRYKRLAVPYKIILYFLVMSAVVNGIAVVLAIENIPNLIVFHLYTILEFGCISWFYSYFFQSTLKSSVVWIVGIFTLLCIVNVLFIQTTLFNTYSRSLEAIIIVGYCILYFSKQSVSNEADTWGSKGINWINSGILLYYSSCFFTFTFSNYLLNASALINHIVWCFADTVLLGEYILFAIGFYQCRNQAITSSY